MNRQDEAVQDLTALLKARNTLMWLVSNEELRVERALLSVAKNMKPPMDLRFWDCVDGIQSAVGETVEDAKDPMLALDYINKNKTRTLYVMRDLHKWLAQDPIVLRSVRSLARKLQGFGGQEARAIVVLTPSAEVPPELSGAATVMDWPLPDRDEMSAILDNVLGSLDEDLKAAALPKNGAREAAIDAAVGLTADEAMNSYAKSLVTERRIDPTVVSNEKKRIIARERVLTWYDPDPRGLDSVGGLDALKGWLVGRKAAFSAKAREYGLPAPKGVLLVGPPGCGKSLTAKCISTAWGQPLLRLDLGALKSKWVGESEGNIRKALQVAETVAPCVLWLDEIEKALGGSTGPQGDGGVGSDALGTILTFMQERAGRVFVIATANDVTGLPPELLRKGRFDEMFFIDLPNEEERMAVLEAALLKYGIEPDDVDGLEGLGADLIRATQEFTGAEIDAVIPDAMYAAFADDARPINASDLLVSMETVVPLAKTAGEKIKVLRDWAEGRARKATSPRTRTTTRKKAGRAIEL